MSVAVERLPTYALCFADCSAEQSEAARRCADTPNVADNLPAPRQRLQQAMIISALIVCLMPVAVWLSGLSVVVKFLLLILEIVHPYRRRFAHVPELSDEALPVYSIFLPVYKEADVLPKLIQRLSQLDYPHEKLDIHLLIESDDLITQQALNDCDMCLPMHIRSVRAAAPRTKPKAMNSCLPDVRGTLLTVYDAEDFPDPKQLRQAAAMFAAQPNLAGVQARLAFFNTVNPLTRAFAAEYDAWFGIWLPGSERFGMPIPFGGTSMHLRTEALRAVGGWDPHNLTEDCDLGVRFARRGYRCAMMDSVTGEEAPERPGAWLRQRTRWIQGYIQTLSVHAGRALHADLGWRRSIGFYVTVAGSVAAPLLYLPLLVQGLIWHTSTAAIVLSAAWAVHALAALQGAWRRRSFGMIRGAFWLPLYWLWAHAAVLRAIYRHLTDRSDWEKTAHGLAKIQPLSFNFANIR